MNLGTFRRFFKSNMGFSFGKNEGSLWIESRYRSKNLNFFLKVGEYPGPNDLRVEHDDQ